MSIDSAIRRFRASQAAQFSQTANVYRPVGEPTYDPNTQQSGQPVETAYSLIECKLTSDDSQGRETEAGQTEVRLIRHMVKFPVGTDILNGDLITIASSTYNPTDVGRQYRVLDVDRREWQISRRCSIEEVVVPLLNDDLEES